MAAGLEIEVIIDGQKFNAQLQKVEDKSKKSGKKIANNISSGVGSITKSIGALAARLGPLAVAIGGALGGRAVINAAARQEDAINRLNNSLARIGQFSQSTSQDLQNFATQLQQTTRFGDEAILEQLAFAQSLGATAEQSKQVVSAAADLATALNIDLNSATRNVAKTLGGYAGELGEVIPELKNFSAEQLRAGAGVDILAQKFSGLAAGDIQSFNGAVASLGNVFGDLLEEIGFFITRSPLVLKAVNAIKQGFIVAIDSIKAFRASFNLSDILQVLVDFAKANQDLVVRPILKVVKVVDFVFNALEQGVRTVVAGIFKTLGLLGDGLAALGFKDKIVGQLQSLNESAKEQFNILAENGKVVGDSFVSIFDEENTAQATQYFENLKLNIDLLNEKIATSPKLNPLGTAEERQSNLAAFNEQFSAGFDQAFNSFKNFEKNTKTLGASVARNLTSGIGNAAGQAFAAFGKALATGENGLKAFVKSFVASIGQIAIQQGTQFILTGIGYQFVPGFQGIGAGLIAAGATLAAFGGALSAVSGGGGGGTASPAVGGGGLATDSFGQTLIQPSTQEEREPRTEINVNVQGDVLDSDESALRITQLLQKAVNEQDVKVIGLA
jgi:hypothetical protein